MPRQDTIHTRKRRAKGKEARDRRAVNDLDAAWSSSLDKFTPGKTDGTPFDRSRFALLEWTAS